MAKKDSKTDTNINSKLNDDMNEANNIENALKDINAIENETKIMQQEALNKSHDVEASNASLSGTGSLNIITDTDVATAMETLMKYKNNKAELEQRLIDNERIWKMQHWDVASESSSLKGDAAALRVQPKSAWLVNTILNKHADAMDNFPSANILPRAKDDEAVAKELSSIIPVILDQNNFEKTYSDLQWYKAKHGTNCCGVFWNNEKDGGLGNIDVKKIDISSLYWQSGCENIQDSPNVFLVSMVDNDEIEKRYPSLTKPLGSMPISINDQFNYGVDVDTSEKTAVVDWYYKKRIQGTDKYGIPQVKTLVHYCVFCNGQVIYASENDKNYTDIGWYNHGLYPFVFDRLFPIEKSICGMGYIDLIADDQLYIDKLQQAILENALTNARPRYLSRGDGNVNEEELLDNSKPVVHVEGDLSEASFRQISVNPLSSIYETVYLQKIQEMKETSGNTAVSQGQSSNATAASAIASLQEASGKLSRDSTQESYRAYKEMIYMIIELIRQFYTESRCFRITGEDGTNDFIDFDNRKLVPQKQPILLDQMGQVIDLGSRMPILDIEVKTQKRSAYSKESQNQTALQLYQMGFFAPANADASLACLNMMEFDDIDKMKEIVRQNGTLFDMVLQLQQQLMQLSTIVDAQNGTNLTSDIAQEAETQGKASSGKSIESGTVNQSKGSLSSQAATATRESTAPR